MISGLPKYILIQNSRYTVLRKVPGEAYVLVKRTMICIERGCLSEMEITNPSIVRMVYPLVPNFFTKISAYSNGRFITCNNKKW